MLGRGHPISASIALYFSMLGAALVVAVIAASEASSLASVLIVIDVLLTVVVFVWLIATVGYVGPALAARPKAKWYGAAAGLACVTFGLALVVLELLTEVLGVRQVGYSAPFLRAGYGWSAVILFVCVQPAIVEELAFRGVILGALRGVVGTRDAVVVSSLMFAFLHLGILSFPHLFLIGLMLGFLRVRSGSLYPCMLMHFLHNLLVVLSELWTR